MLRAGLTVELTLFAFKWLNDKGQRFDNVAKLVAAVKRMAERFLACEAELLDYMSGKECRLLTRPCNVTQQDVAQLFVKGQAGPQTMDYLYLLQQQGHEFESVIPDLAAAVASARQADSVAAMQLNTLTEDSQLSIPEQRHVLTRYLTSRKARLFLAGAEYNSVRSSTNRSQNTYRIVTNTCRKHKKPSFNFNSTPKSRQGNTINSPEETVICVSAEGVQITSADLDDLLDAGNTLRKTLFHLHCLSRSKRQRTFTSMESIVKAVRRAREESLQTKTMLLTFFQSPHCNLFYQPVRVTTRDIDNLYYVGGAGEDTAIHLEQLQASDQQFASMNKLIASMYTVHKKHLRMLRKMKEKETEVRAADEQKATTLLGQLVQGSTDASSYDSIALYLASSSCSLFCADDEIDILEHDLQNMITLGGGGSVSITLLHLQYLDDMGEKFSSVVDLINYLSKCQKDLQSHLAAMLSFLTKPGSNLVEDIYTAFEDESATADAPREAQLHSTSKQTLKSNPSRQEDEVLERKGMNLMLRLYMDGFAGPLSLNVLQELDKAQKSFKSLKDRGSVFVCLLPNYSASRPTDVARFFDVCWM